mmetsp:Transcript_13083/g.27500  ORF Transcript_13083/g.27500 Transcript_13083/m.27500 type:complete len:108 (-) Transcript_13083:272-595(-)
MSRTDGRKLVAMATTLTISALGIGTIYLPFIADRDKLRGLFEEGEESIPEGARKEIQAIIKKEKEQAQELAKQQQMFDEQEKREEEERQKQQQSKRAGSMWSSFRRG